MLLPNDSRSEDVIPLQSLPLPQYEVLNGIDGVNWLDIGFDRKLVEQIRATFSTSFPYKGAIILLSTDDNEEEDSSFDSLAKRLWREVRDAAKVEAGQGLYVLWDEYSYRSVQLQAHTVEKHLSDLIALPPHMYIIPEDVSWCICFRMEGDMGFGFASQRTTRQE